MKNKKLEKLFGVKNLTPYKYGKSLCEDGKLNGESIIPYDIGYEMEGYEIFEESDNGDTNMKKLGKVKE